MIVAGGPKILQKIISSVLSRIWNVREISGSNEQTFCCTFEKSSLNSSSTRCLNPWTFSRFHDLSSARKDICLQNFWTQPGRISPKAISVTLPLVIDFDPLWILWCLESFYLLGVLADETPTVGVGLLLQDLLRILWFSTLKKLRSIDGCAQTISGSIGLGHLLWLQSVEGVRDSVCNGIRYILIGFTSPWDPINHTNCTPRTLNST